MKMPFAELALVEPAKLTEYLLNPAHPDNGGKAAFFYALGFGGGDWQLLAVALQSVARSNEIAVRMETRHGTKYIIEGALKASDGGSRMIRTVWIVNHSERIPRLVSAYPLPKGASHDS